MKTYIIGVTGASSSGKSTVCKTLCQIVPHSYLIQQDDYFKAEKDVPFDEERNEHDWDCPEAINYEQLIKDLSIWKAGGNIEKSNKLTNFKDDAKFTLSKETADQIDVQLQVFQRRKDVRVIFVDGFLLMANSKLMDLFDLTLFIKTGYETLKRRRENRVYIIDGKGWVEPEGYFEKFVWPGYYQHHKPLFVSLDEELIRVNGGDLSQKFKERYKVAEFANDDQTDFDSLLLNVIQVVKDFIAI